MNADREQMYRYSRPAAYSGELSRVGPIRRRFAVMAIVCVVFMAGMILAAGVIGRALASAF